MKTSFWYSKIIELLWKRSVGARKHLAKRFIAAFPGLYSTIDSNGVVPQIQIAAYHLVNQKYVRGSDSVLDVGFGTGKGLNILAEKTATVSGIDIDRVAVAQGRRMLLHNPKIQEIKHYDGLNIPFGQKSFDVVVCVDVLEHVPKYETLIKNMCAIARRTVIISTPNRRDEFTSADGSPKNPWHIREWSYDDLNRILTGMGLTVEWNLLNGDWGGPFDVSSKLNNATMALTPAIIIR